MSFQPLYVVIHHSLTSDQQVMDYEAIRRYHMEVKGWADFAYHAAVELGGKAFVPLMGRAWDQEGAHTKEQNMNHIGLGLLLVGNFDSAPPPDAQLEVARDRFLVPWMRMYGIPAQNIHPHRLYAPKSCPGHAFTHAVISRFIPGVNPLKWR